MAISPLGAKPYPQPRSASPPLVSEETNDTFRYLVPLPYTWRPRRAAAAEHTLLPLPPSFFSLSTGTPTYLPACLPAFRPLPPVRNCTWTWTPASRTWHTKITRSSSASTTSRYPWCVCTSYVTKYIEFPGGVYSCDQGSYFTLDDSQTCMVVCALCV